MMPKEDELSLMKVTANSSHESGETNPDGEPRSTETAENDCSESGSEYAVTRRDVVLTSTVAGLFGGGSLSAGSVAAEAGSGKITIDTSDAVGANHVRKPTQFHLGSGSEFTITTSNMEDGKVLLIALEARPDGGNYHKLAEEGFIVDGDSFTFDAGDLHKAERDFTRHPEISLTDFEIDSSIEELAHKENKTKTRTFDLRIRIIDENKQTVAKGTQSFEVTYGLLGGPGVRLGYNSMRVAPTDRIRDTLSR
jgi:hypothetical protein